MQTNTETKLVENIRFLRDIDAMLRTVGLHIKSLAVELQIVHSHALFQFPHLNSIHQKF